MNKIFKKLILPIVVAIAICGFAPRAFAIAPPLVVNFESTPLFSEANFAPGNQVIRTVGVSNNSDTSQNIITEATNAVDIGGLGDKLNLVIREGEEIRYTGTLGQFIRAGEVSLSPLPNGGSTTYSFGVTFESGANNDTQNKTLGFDLCVGFEGGDKHCGDTVIGGGGGGTVGGSGGGAVTLVIYNEQALDISNVGQSGSATITWDTNKLSTSQVIYGIAPGPYNLNLGVLPYFGYPLGTVEDSNKVTSHSVLLTGLVPGQTYLYRVVSRASPPTISYEHRFVVPALAVATVPPEQTPSGEVLGASTINDGGNTGNQNGEGNGTDLNVTIPNDNTLGLSAAALLGIGFLPWPWGIGLWLLLLLLLLLLLFERRKKKKDTFN